MVDPASINFSADFDLAPPQAATAHKTLPQHETWCKLRYIVYILNLLYLFNLNAAFRCRNSTNCLVLLEMGDLTLPPAILDGFAPPTQHQPPRNRVAFCTSLHCR